MKLIIVTILTIYSISLFAIKWDDASDFSRFKRDKNNFILLYFNSPSCSACKAIDKKFKSSKVEKLLKDFKKIKITRATKEGRELTEEFNVTGYPSLYIVNGKDKRLLVKGAPHDLLRFLKQKLKPELRKIKNRPKEPVAPKVNMGNLRKSYEDISKFYLKQKKYKDAIIYLEKLKKLNNDDLFASYELGRSKYYIAKELKGKENRIKKIKLLQAAKGNLDDAILRSRGYLGNQELSLVKDEINKTIKNKK